jgi:hypothetical protein
MTIALRYYKISALTYNYGNTVHMKDYKIISLHVFVWEEKIPD